MSSGLHRTPRPSISSYTNLSPPKFRAVYLAVNVIYFTACQTDPIPTREAPPASAATLLEITFIALIFLNNCKTVYDTSYLVRRLGRTTPTTTITTSSFGFVTASDTLWTLTRECENLSLFQATVESNSKLERYEN